MRILFVDDEPLVLSGIENAMLFADDDWTAHFASSGEEAIALLGVNEYDALVTDMKMPGLTGADVLEHAMANHPGVVRIVLSGEVDTALAARGIPLSHEFVSKPCDPDDLFRVLARVHRTAGTFGCRMVRDVLGSLDRLPSQPGLHLRIQEAIDGNEGADALARLIETDLAIAASVIKTANSAFYGFRIPAEDVRDAVVRLGAETVSGIVLNAEIASWAPAEMRATVASLNSRSTLVAHVVRKLIGGEVGQASLAGLLHDVGTLVLITQFPDEYGALQQAVDGDPRRAEDLEREMFDTSHAEIGAYMLEMWNADPVVVEVARFHHDPIDASLGDEARRIIEAITAVDVANEPDPDHPSWLDPGLVARAAALVGEARDRTRAS